MKQTIIFLLIFCFSGLTQNRKPIYLSIQYACEVRLPAPYTDIFIPIKFIDHREIKGTNKTSFYLHPNKAKRGRTNIKIHCQGYSFDIEVFVNSKGRKPTRVLDLTKNIMAQEKIGSTDKKGSVGIVERIKAKIHFTKKSSDFSLIALTRIKPHLMEPNKRGISTRKNRVSFAVDYVFYHQKKIVFKLAVDNHSSTPYNISELSIHYREYKKHLFRKPDEIKNDPLIMFYNEYSTKQIQPKTTGHILYVAENIGTKDSGKFHFFLKEKNGSRNFSVEIPSKF